MRIAYRCSRARRGHDQDVVVDSCGLGIADAREAEGDVGGGGVVGVCGGWGMEGGGVEKVSGAGSGMGVGVWRDSAGRVKGRVGGVLHPKYVDMCALASVSIRDIA